MGECNSSLLTSLYADILTSITPWVTNMGYQNAFILAAFAGLAQVLTFLIFVKWGKKMREASLPRYWKYLREMSAAGLTH